MSRLISLSDYRPQEQRWLWPGRIPFAAITLLEGDPGANKSTLIADVIGRTTTGRPFFGCSAASAPCVTILVQREETLDRVHANHKAAGADLDRVKVLQKETDAGRVAFPGCIDLMRAWINEHRPGLFVLDPVSEFIEGSLNSESSVRPWLNTLAALAQQHDMAVVLVRHLNKSVNANVLYRGVGSIALTAVARSVLLLASDPGDPTRRILAATKHSLCDGQPSLVFKPVPYGDGLVIEWLGETQCSAQSLLEQASPSASSQLHDAIYLLYSLLWDAPMLANQVQRLARENGVADRTLRRAKLALRVQSKRVGFGPSSRFVWSLPKDDQMVKELRDRDMENLVDALIYGELSDPVPITNHRTCPTTPVPPKPKTADQGGRPPDQSEPPNPTDARDDDQEGFDAVQP